MLLGIAHLRENCVLSSEANLSVKAVPGSSSLSGVNGLVHLLVMGFQASTKPCLPRCKQGIVRADHIDWDAPCLSVPGVARLHRGGAQEVPLCGC